MIRRNRYDPKFLQNTLAVQKTSCITGPTPPSALLEEKDTMENEVPSPYNVFYEALPGSPGVNYACTTDLPQLKSSTDLDAGYDGPISDVKPLAMQAAIREAWTCKENTGNLSQFFLSGVNKSEATPHNIINETQDKEVSNEVMFNCTTGTWKPEQSIVGNYQSFKLQDDASDSDITDDALDLVNCESDKEEWEMDDRITLECLERELQASQLGSNPEQEHQEIINYNNDFEETERQIQKDKQ